MTSSNFTEITHHGIKVLCDYALLEKRSYDYKPVLLSIYGSETQVRAIHSALILNYTLTTNDMKIYKNVYDSLRFKHHKLGYGKYNAVIYNEKDLPNSIIVFPNENLQESFANFIATKTIPFKSDWTNEFIKKGIENDLITELVSLGDIKGYKLSETDEDICDFIIEEIYIKEEEKCP